MAETVADSTRLAELQRMIVRARDYPTVRTVELLGEEAVRLLEENVRLRKALENAD